MQDAAEEDFDEAEDAGDDALLPELKEVEPDDYDKLPDDEVDEPDPALESQEERT